MTVGEKIKDARQQSGLSQEQLANKLNVSRSAIAKWENNRGMPDVDNLKMISQLLNVSIDYLLDEDMSLEKYVIKEDIDLSKYKGRKKIKKDQIVKEKYSDAKIMTLIGKIKLTKSEKVIDNALGFLTSAPFGIPDFINGMKNIDKEFYLVDQGHKQFLVVVTDEFMESRELVEKKTERKFEIGHRQFLNCGCIKDNG